MFLGEEGAAAQCYSHWFHVHSRQMCEGPLKTHANQCTSTSGTNMTCVCAVFVELGDQNEKYEYASEKLWDVDSVTTRYNPFQ